MAQVEPQFLDGAPHLDPRMPESHDAIDAAAIIHMLHHIARMVQRSLVHLVALHREDTPIAAGQSLELRAEVCAASRGTEVVDHVARGHDAQPVREQQMGPEDSLVECLPLSTMATTHGQEVVAQPSFAHECFDAADGRLVVQPRVMLVPLVHHATPRGPAPDAEVRGEEIVGSRIGRLLLQVESRHHRNARVVLVTVEHFLAEAEERYAGYIVVLQHHTLVGHREGPLL